MCFLVKRKRGFNSRHWAERGCGGEGGGENIKNIYIGK